MFFLAYLCLEFFDSLYFRKIKNQHKHILLLFCAKFGIKKLYGKYLIILE